MRLGSPPRARRPLCVEALEDRYALSAVSLSIALDPGLDVTGRQVIAVEAFQDSNRATFALFDTGSSAVTFSAANQSKFTASGNPIPVLIKGGGILTGLGGTQTGDISNPGNIFADGIHAARFTIDKAGEGSFSFTFGPAAALGAKEQAFVGTTQGSSNVQTIVGTPVLRSSANPNGLAAQVIMQGMTFDLSEVADGLYAVYPDLRFVQPGTMLSAAAGTTDPVQIRLSLIGADNTANPANDITEAPIPVASNVSVQLSGAQETQKQFLFDTGSQITVISTSMAKSLGLDLTQPAFTTTVDGIGGPALLPGFLVDSLSVPTLAGGQLTFTKVPVFVAGLGGGVDGILGMNLFNTATAFIYDPYAPGGATLSASFSLNSSRSTLDPRALDFLAPLGLNFADSLDGPTQPTTKPSLGSITGTVYNDINGNSRRDSGEGGLGAKTVYIDINRDGKQNTGDLVATTDAQGGYIFSDLQPGQYVVTTVVPSGWTGTSPSKGSATITVTANATTPLDFGEQKNATDPLVGYINQLYGSMLFRAPDQTSLNTWLAALKRGVSKTAMTQALWVTPEHRGIQVQYVYQTYLNRAPSAPEKNVWVARLMTGWTQDLMSQSLVMTPEYLGKYGNPTAFLGKLFSDVYGRGIDLGSQYYWGRALGIGVSRAQVASSILNTSEAAIHRVAVVYSMVLHRQADADAANNWGMPIYLRRTSSDQLAIALYASQAFTDLAASLVG